MSDIFCTANMYVDASLHFPDDRSRVCLKESPGVDSCDYINASFIDVRSETQSHVKNIF